MEPDGAMYTDYKIIQKMIHKISGNGNEDEC